MRSNNFLLVYIKMPLATFNATLLCQVFMSPPFFACITQQKCQIISHIIKKRLFQLNRIEISKIHQGYNVLVSYCIKTELELLQDTVLSKKSSSSLSVPLCYARYINQQTSHHLPRGAPYYMNMHGLRTPREEIAFTARPKIHSHSQIFRYGRSIF